MSVRNLSRGVDLVRHLEVAHSVRDRMRGLLGRDHLEPDRALWIQPCKSIHTFGMRFTIDAAFLDRDGRVLRTYPALGPSRMTRVVWRAVGVLELASGVLEASGTRAGDLLDLGTWAACGDLRRDQAPAPAPGVTRLNPSLGRVALPVDPAGIPEDLARSREASVEVLRFLPFSLDPSRRVPVYPSPLGLVDRPIR